MRLGTDGQRTHPAGNVQRTNSYLQYEKGGVFIHGHAPPTYTSAPNLHEGETAETVERVSREGRDPVVAEGSAVVERSGRAIGKIGDRSV